MSNETDLAWAAGVIDGDGCIAIRRSKKTGCAKQQYALIIRVVQAGPLTVQPPMILKLHTLLGGSVRIKARNIPGHAPVWEWSCASKKAEEILRLVLPYLVQKQDQGREALLYREAVGRPGTRTDLVKAETHYQRLRALKLQYREEVT